MSTNSDIQTWSNGSLGSASVDASSLGEVVKMQLLRDAVRMYEANQRQGTVKTKTRAETSYTTRKPYKQKGTGNARRGDFNSPLLRGGGVIFGPRPRDYSYKMPRKALREALRSALLGKLRDGEVHGLDSAAFSKPSTKTAAAALAALGCDGSAAIVVPAENENLLLSFRNLPRVHVIPASDLNTHHVLWHRRVLLVDGAWDVLMNRLAGAANGAAEKEAVEA
ncbi:MAG: 50S ribosomal protein L4 [Planctomycetota bacterium]|nr:MAG: 50S ribosomal protein L4 [Planctomycetota bacterium]